MPSNGSDRSVSPGTRTSSTSTTSSKPGPHGSPRGCRRDSRMSPARSGRGRSAAAGKAGAERPRIAAALGKHVEDTLHERPATLFVGDIPGLEPAFGGGPGHDLFVHVEVAEPLRDLLSDLLAARPGRVREANHGVRHGA